MDMILGNYIIINQEFFGVSKDDEDNIIFVGGNMNDQNRMFNYKYKTKENKVEMTNISLELREKLKNNFSLCNFKILKKLESVDGTKKYLFDLLIIYYLIQ